MSKIYITFYEFTNAALRSKYPLVSFKYRHVIDLSEEASQESIRSLNATGDYKLLGCKVLEDREDITASLAESIKKSNELGKLEIKL